MLTLRNMAAAFLHNNGKYLLMKRADNRKIASGVWSSVGGHMEPREINDPLGCCYREIEEETGIKRYQIPSLDLMYIIIRRSKDEIRLIYIYFGETTETEINIKTDEGELFWIPQGELSDREYTKTYKAMVEHFVERSPEDKAVYIGAAGNNHGEMHMSWIKFGDFK